MLEFDWYSYQCFWCWFGSARTWSLLLTQSAQIRLDQCMHLLISLYTWSIYIGRHCSQFLQCEDWKTGWCTKAHTNFFANDNKRGKALFNEWMSQHLPTWRSGLTWLQCWWAAQLNEPTLVSMEIAMKLQSGLGAQIPLTESSESQWWVHGTCSFQ